MRASDMQASVPQTSNRRQAQVNRAVAGLPVTLTPDFFNVWKVRAMQRQSIRVPLAASTCAARNSEPAIRMRGGSTNGREAKSLSASSTQGAAAQ